MQYTFNTQPPPLLGMFILLVVFEKCGLLISTSFSASLQIGSQ